MRVVAYYALHYGTEYLPWSIRSIEPFVDEIRVLYTPIPSFGHGTSVRCPETQEQLWEAARRFLIDDAKLVWRSGLWTGEGAHRDAAEQGLRDTDTLLLHVDADEVWVPEALRALLAFVARGHTGPPHRSWRVPFVHFFRSFGWACTDALMPERIVDLRPGCEKGWGHFRDMAPVLHFGYAQSEAIVRYKWCCHGHQTELRRGWLERFKNWQPGQDDMHPTNELGFWNPRPTALPLIDAVRELMHDHPYRDFDVIP